MEIALALIVLGVLTLVFHGRRERRGAPRLRASLGPEPLAATSLPGGDPADPILVSSPAVIEEHARRWPCVVCSSRVRCDHHQAEEIAGRRLRVARVHCPQCGFERDLYFALRSRAGAN